MSSVTIAMAIHCFGLSRPEKLCRIKDVWERERERGSKGARREIERERVQGEREREGEGETEQGEIKQTGTIRLGSNPFIFKCPIERILLYWWVNVKSIVCRDLISQGDTTENCNYVEAMKMKITFQYCTLTRSSGEQTGGNTQIRAPAVSP